MGSDCQSLPGTNWWRVKWATCAVPGVRLQREAQALFPEGQVEAHTHTAGSAPDLDAGLRWG